jgi:hypothetical protein
MIRPKGPLRYDIVKVVSGDRHHYIQAALLGAFGDVQPRLPLRDTPIEIRRQGSDTTETTTPDQVGWVRELYRLTSVPAGVDPDLVDREWTPIENAYRDRVTKLENRSTDAADLEWLIKYVCAAGVRHPDFADAVNRWRAEVGQPPIAGDAVQVARLVFLDNGLAPLGQFRWRIAHSRPEAPRFIVNDLAWMYVADPGMRGRGLVVPLNSRVAALAWIDQANRGAVDHQDMRPGTIRWVNAATWEQAPQFAVGHPDDRSYLMELRNAAYVGNRVATQLGAYYGFETRNPRPGLFADL